MRAATTPRTRRRTKEPSLTPERSVWRATLRPSGPAAGAWLGSLIAGGTARASGPLLLAQERIQSAADLQAALGGPALEKLLPRADRDGEVLAGEIDPGHRLLRAALPIEKRAQLDVRVQVAREGLHGRAPLVAGVPLFETFDLRHQDLGADHGDAAGPGMAVELDLDRAVGFGLRCDRGHRTHRLQLLG